MENKICIDCLKELPKSEFTKKKNNCKSCRNSKAKNKYDGDLRVEQYRRQKEKHFLDERTPIRNQLVRELVEIGGWPIDKIGEGYVKLEEFNELKENPDYHFTYYEHPQQAMEDDYMRKFALNICFADKYGERKLRPIIYII